MHMNEMNYSVKHHEKYIEDFSFSWPHTSPFGRDVVSIFSGYMVEM